jgi:hypothetical protein
MKELIKIHNQGSELQADSREVAKIFGVEHQHLRETIEANEQPLSQLGIFQFETGKISPNERGRPEKFCYLNFDQIALLLTLTRSTEKTKEFRLKLIISFREARKKLRPIDHALLSIPHDWRKTFPDDFYEALLRLYGEDFEQSNDRPSWVGRWTNKFIYAPLCDQLPAELKARRLSHCGQDGPDSALKLHQYIEKHAKKNLEKHISQVTALLRAATSSHHFRELFASVFYGRKQLLLGHQDRPDEFA